MMGKFNLLACHAGSFAAGAQAAETLYAMGGLSGGAGLPLYDQKNRGKEEPASS